MFFFFDITKSFFVFDFFTFKSFGIYHVDLISLYQYILVIFFLIFILLLLSLSLSNSLLGKSNLLKMLPYECGFTPVYLDNKSKIHLSYFRVILVFLIFDLEVLYLFPFFFVSKFFFLNGLFFLSYFFLIILFVILIGVLYEYISGILDWRIK